MVLENNGEGFAGGIGATAGSAVFNSMIIPALVILVAIQTKGVKSITVSRNVILRDGITLILCELVLIVMISGEKLYWWHGFLLMALYVGYVLYMLDPWKWRKSSKIEADETPEEEPEQEVKPEPEQAADIDGEDNTDIPLPTLERLKAFFILDLEKAIAGHQLNQTKARTLLVIATLIIAAACWFLVDACDKLGGILGFQTYFIAIIIAAAATSVPDTIISIRSATKNSENGEQSTENYNDAISNALGSNIFDICFALGFPLFVYTLFIESPILLYTNDPIGSTVGDDVSELRIILLGLTVMAFLIYIIGKQMTKFKAFLLLLTYFAFLLYILGKANGSEWAKVISEWVKVI